VPLLRLISCLALACACAGPGAVVAPRSSASPLLGGNLPELRRRTLAGAAFSSEAQRGRLVVVKFFAKYCVPCQRTLPEAERLARRFTDVAVVGISEDEDAALALDQVARYGLSFPVILDSGNVLAGRFRVTEMPVSFLADRDGRIVWVGGPEQGEDALENAVAAARQERSP